MKQKLLTKTIVFIILMCILSNVFSLKVVASQSNPNYAEALQLSLYFYDANRCGSGITNAAITWRGDCHTYDATLDLKNTNLPQDFINKYKNILDPDGDGKIDVSGGFHDAGDHIKCAQNAGYTLATLNLGYYKFENAYEKAGEKAHIEAIIKEFSNYIMKCTYLNENNEAIAFCYQVGDGNDHSHWEAPEGQTINRPAFFLYEGNFGTEQAMQCSAGLLSTAVNLRDTDKTYADKCIKYAKALYNFGMKYKGSTPNHDGYFYASTNGYDDDIAWAEAWMYLATNDAKYLNQAKNANINDGWIHCWDKVWGGFVALMADITKDPKYINLLSQNIENLRNSYKTPAGFICIGNWGSARHNAAWQIYGLMYAKVTGDTKYLAECETQMQYILGKNPMGRSYLIGYSNNYAKHPHHRGVSVNNSGAELIGALVGGPNSQDQHNDSKDDYVQNEVAIDYNASFVTAAAGLYSLIGINKGNTPVTLNYSEINSSYYNNTQLEPNNNYKIKDGFLYVKKAKTKIQTFAGYFNVEIKLYDKNNNIVTNTSEYIKTNMNAQIGNNTYKVIVTGDLDGDGEISITDVVRTNLYSVHLITLNEIEKHAVDADFDGEMTITDLVIIHLRSVGLGWI